MMAALYVQTDGCYFGLDGVDPWDERRDARLYNGPHPVIAHPPCQRYGRLGAINYGRWGGEHNRPLNDGGTFAAALAAVNYWGGVLEHPADSMAWPAYNLVKPSLRGGWSRSGIGWVCEVWQSAYSHRARKRTWLYCVGHDPPPDLDWSQSPGTHQIGGKRAVGISKPTLSPAEASATPTRFRDVLIELAEGASK